MSPLSDHGPHTLRGSIRMDARLDAAPHAKVDAFAKRFHWPWAAVLRYIMEGRPQPRPGSIIRPDEALQPHAPADVRILRHGDV